MYSDRSYCASIILYALKPGSNRQNYTHWSQMIIKRCVCEVRPYPTNLYVYVECDKNNDTIILTKFHLCSQILYRIFSLFFLFYILYLWLYKNEYVAVESQTDLVDVIIWTNKFQFQHSGMRSVRRVRWMCIKYHYQYT